MTTTLLQSLRSRPWRLIAFLFLVTGILTVQAVPPAPPVATIYTNIPLVDKGYGVIGRDDGLSVKIGSNCCFFFGDTVLNQSNAQGSYWVVNTMYHTTNTNGDTGVSGGYNWISNGVPPTQFIPYTPDETNWNATNANGYVYGIWPYAQFYSPTDGKQYLTIAKVIESPTLTALGIGLAVCPTNPVTTNATRVQSRPGNAQPYLLWDESAGEWGNMAATLSNYVYFYWVSGQDYGVVYVARASLLGGPDFLQQTNWQYWNGTNWIANSPSSAAYLFGDAGIGTIDWNAFLTNDSGGRGCYLYTYMSWVANEVYTRASSDLVHWSAPTLQYTVPVSWGSGYFPYFGRAAKCLEQNNGQTIYISWSLPDTNISLPENMPMIRARFPAVNPAFTNLTASQSIGYGASNVTLSGNLNALGIYPATGETITVTINGNAQTAAISDSTGDFSLNYNSSTLPANASPYPITYSYTGDTSLNPATNTSTTLTVIALPVIQTAQQSGGSFAFTWSAVTNRTYQIQSTASLAPPNWTNSGSAITASNSTMTTTEPLNTNSQQFYRIVLLL